MIRLRLPELPFRGVPGGVFFLPGCPGGRPSEGRKCPDGAPEGPAGDTPAGVPCAPKCSAGRCVKEARGSVAPPSAQHVVFCGRRGCAALRAEAPGAFALRETRCFLWNPGAFFRVVRPCPTLHVKKRGGTCVAPRSPARVAFCCVKAVSAEGVVFQKTPRGVA